jgi:hypothetical protein
MPRRTPIESIPELRRICQDPVRVYNDLTGSLYGWRISIYITRIFLSLGLTASFASSLMVAAGLVGSLLCAFGGGYSVAGLATLAFSYILDCVDGEMARYRRIDSFRWAGIDYLHHMLMKGFSFLALGIGVYVATGNPWTMAAGGACSIFWLLLMGVRDLPMMLFAKKIVANDKRSANPAFQRLRRHLRDLQRVRRDTSPPLDVWGRDFKFQPWMIRTFFTSYDIMVLLALTTAIIDLWRPPTPFFGMPFSATAWLLCGYSIILPLHFADALWTAMLRKQVRNELYELAGKIDAAATETLLESEPASPKVPSPGTQGTPVRDGS